MGRDYSHFRTEEELSAAADADNCEVVYPSSYQLLIDIDSYANLELFRQQLALLKEKLPLLVRSVESWPSKSGNTHVRVTLTSEISHVERIALQAALGSDPKRELLSFTQEYDGFINPTVLFRPRTALIEVLC